MAVKSKITKRLKNVWDIGKVNATSVYRGTDYDGVIQAHGWWVRPFGETPIFLGKNEVEALETIEYFSSGNERTK